LDDTLRPRPVSSTPRALRFVVASAVGAGIDFLAASGSLYLGAIMPVALAAGWASGLGVGYWVQAVWTFGVPPGWRTFLQFAINCAFLLPVRYIAVSAMALVSPAGFYWDCGRIILAMCITLALNYQISRMLIFRSKMGPSE
jgi:putative flippase GtrA